MKPFVFVGLGLGVSLLAGCGGSLPASMPSGAATEPVSPRSAWLAGSMLARPDGGRSWMNPDAKKRDLLYVSDDTTFDVYVFTYPKGILVGTLTGFSGPGGLCADSRGDVFVPNVFTSTIEEFAHGGTSPIATLGEAPHSFPNSCDVSRTNGDLAVGDGASGIDGEGRGAIAIYRSAAGTPSIHKAMYHPYSCGYDSEGNLFVDGEGAGFQNFKFGELPASGKRYRKIVLNQPIALAGGVVWEGNTVAVGDVYGAAIYEFFVSGSRGTRVRTTRLPGTTIAWEFKVDGTKAIVPNYVFYREDSSDVLSYDYPAGGPALKTFGAGAVVDPVGAAVSRVH
ncbi:MAG: hypothetical protein WCC84_03030 [Candidatus Cybelea sp.]